LLFRKANQDGAIFAFEPVESNARQLKAHVQLNNVSGLSVFIKAVSDQEGVLSFSRAKTSVAGRLSSTGDETVEVVRLSRWVTEGIVDAPDLIKMDIEGEEARVLSDIINLLATYRPKIFLSTHGQKIHRQCISMLADLGYSFKPLDVPELADCKEVLVY
jgi:FkbM family methyltransferase